MTVHTTPGSPLSRCMALLVALGWDCALTSADNGRVRLDARCETVSIEVVGRPDVVVASLQLLANAAPA